MCGIVGYVGLDAAPDGNKFDHDAYKVVIEGLRRQEYRGYDSAGVALVCPDGIEFRKKAGKLINLEHEVEDAPLTESQIGIGHTRWATHGGPTDNNAHPHVVDHGRLAVVHNGIIENFAELRAELLAEGVEFQSQTDTEVAAALIASIYNKLGTKDLTEAVREASNRMEGAFTILAVHADHPDRVVATRRNSPLVIGLGENENFLGSDVSAFIDHTKEAVEMGQDQIVTITGTDYSIIDFAATPAEAVSKKAKSIKKPYTDNTAALFFEAPLLCAPKSFVAAASFSSNCLLSEKAFKSGIPFTYSTKRLTISARLLPVFSSSVSAFFNAYERKNSANGRTPSIISVIAAFTEKRKKSKSSDTIKSAHIRVHT